MINRKYKIIEILKNEPNGLTARQLATKLHLIERNSTAPILTRLYQQGVLSLNGVRYDRITKRYVSVYVLKGGKENE